MESSPSLGRFPASERPMQIGLFLPMTRDFGLTTDPTYASIRELVLAAEKLGFDSIWSGDHFGAPTETMLGENGWWEMWSFLSALAAITSKVTIGSYVSCVLFRNPGVLAKQAEALDEISSGRFVLGLGAGWNKHEFDMFGFPFDHRLSRLEEGTEIISKLTRTGQADFKGIWYQANAAFNVPRGPSAPDGGVPIMVGGRGKRTVDLAIRLADAWDSDFVPGAAALKPVLEMVDAACEAAGRDPATLVRSTSINVQFTGHVRNWDISIPGERSAIAETMVAIRELGVRQLVIGIDPATRESLEIIAEAIDLAG